MSEAIPSAPYILVSVSCVASGVDLDDESRQFLVPLDSTVLDLKTAVAQMIKDEYEPAADVVAILAITFLAWEGESRALPEQATMLDLEAGFESCFVMRPLAPREA